MPVLQLADLHTEETGGLAYKVADTVAMLHDAVEQILRLRRRPDCVVLTGDIASEAKPGGYRNVRAALERLDMPAYVLPGNHDDRAVLLEHLGPWCPATPETAPHLCYATEADGMRLVMLDTTEPDSHSGHLSEKAAVWLERALEPARPTLLFMHHPPFFLGMGLMDEPFANADRLAALVRDRPHVRLCCGHLHRGYTRLWQGRVAVGAPAVSMQMEVDLRPGGGDTFFMEAPGYALHTLLDGELVTYFCEIACAPTFSGPHPFLGLNPE